MTPDETYCPWGWNKKNLTVLCFLGLLLAGLSGYALFTRPFFVDESLSVEPDPALTTIDRIDPNRAGLPELTCLPGFGPVRAQALIDYRNSFRKTHGPDSHPFKTAGDLTRIRGIGPKTTRKLARLLKFQDEKQPKPQNPNP